MRGGLTYELEEISAGIIFALRFPSNIYFMVSGTSISTVRFGWAPVEVNPCSAILGLYNNKLTSRTIAITRFFIAVDKLDFCINAFKFQGNAEVLAISSVGQGMEILGNKSKVSFDAIKPVLVRITELAVPSTNPNTFVHDGPCCCKVPCIGYIGVEEDAGAGETKIKCKE